MWCYTITKLLSLYVVKLPFFDEGDSNKNEKLLMLVFDSVYSVLTNTIHPGNLFCKRKCSLPDNVHLVVGVTNNITT